ncbi:MAG TPA: hypothetical protein VMP01_22765 [Pirellulaceae bacterium]|nr:hypothetical protein [Pirellulaceae bacterium]
MKSNLLRGLLVFGGIGLIASAPYLSLALANAPHPAVFFAAVAVGANLGACAGRRTPSSFCLWGAITSAVGLWIFYPLLVYLAPQLIQPKTASPQTAEILQYYMGHRLISLSLYSVVRGLVIGAIVGGGVWLVWRAARWVSGKSRPEPVESSPAAPWLRFRLRTLLLVMGAICVYLGWSVYRRDRQMAIAIFALQHGGQVQWDYGRDLDPLGVITSVSFSDKPLHNNELAALADAHSATSLALFRTGISDGGLAHVKDLRSLRSLDLRHNPGITDAGLVHLTGLVNLRQVVLIRTSVTKQGADDLQRALPNTKIAY